MLSLRSADRWQSGTARVLYPVLLDHGSPAMGENKAANAGAATARMWREDGNNYALTSASSESLWLYFVTGHNIIRRRVHFSAAPEPPPPPPPPPLPQTCKTVTVVGAGLAGANGDYISVAGHPAAAPVFVKDLSHQIYAVNYTGARVWHLAHDGVAGSVVYTTISAAAVAGSGAMPPTWGWGLGTSNPSSHVEVAPAPASLTCKTAH